jgi:4-hydroxybenzoate polyprenyltransferase
LAWVQLQNRDLPFPQYDNIRFDYRRSPAVPVVARSHPMKLFHSTRAFLELIKFEHTVFALPFAYLGMLLAAAGLPSAQQFVWITLAMASARTLGMSANRLADRWLDANNPRTAMRPLATGAVAPRTAWAGAAISALILALAARSLGPLPFRLLPGAYVMLIGYPFTKRFTLASHFILGATDALAPVGAWAAIRGHLTYPEDLPAWLLFVAVTLWIAGFDLIYACQDVEFDRHQGLHAVPARFGVAFSLRLSALCHLATALLLASLGPLAGLGWLYLAGVTAACALLFYEHAIVRPDDLSRLNLAFFNVNGIISLTVFAGTLAGLLIR